jgi:voltage-gated potassium channel
MTGPQEPGKPPAQEEYHKQVLDRERWEVLEQVEDWLEIPVIVLGFVWLVLLVVELIWGLTPILNAAVYLIWGVFIVDFGVRFILAPRKLAYLKRNWLTGLSLIVPALRVLRFAQVARVLRAARATQGLRLVNVVGSVNRGMRALRTTLQRRGFIYIVLLTLVVNLVGAAGMFAFENRLPDGGVGLRTYGEAVWWTAMIMTTLGSDFWPHSPEGRLLTLLISLYAFAIFGYVTATLATFFVGQEAAHADLDGDGIPDQAPPLQGRFHDPDQPQVEPAPRKKDDGALASAASVRALRDEVRALRREIAALRQDLVPPPSDSEEEK